MAQDFAYRNYSHTQGKVKNSGGGRTSRYQGKAAASQNFLVNAAAVAQLIAVADPSGSVLEPAAADGVLTKALAQHGARVTAYETDPLLAAKLAARTRGDSGIQVVRADFTKATPPREPFAVVGNIPHSATPRIVGWCLAAPALTSATLLTPDSPGRCSLVTVMSWPWFDWQVHGPVDPNSFHPVPSAGTTILRIRRRPEPLVAARDSYTDLVRLGFSSTRGSVSAALRTRYASVDEALAAAGIGRDTVAGDVDPDQWVRLHDRLIE